MAQQPYPYRQQPVRRKPVQLNLPGASVTPAAQPVDTYYRTNAIAPRQSNSLLQLAGALAPFSQSLGNYLAFEKDNMAKEATAQAEMDVREMSVDKLKAVLSFSKEEQAAHPELFSGPVTSRPDYLITARVHAGKRLMDLGHQDVINQVQSRLAELTDPLKDLNVREELDKIRTEALGGLGELGFYGQQGAEASIDPLIEHLGSKAIEDRDARLVQENKDTIVAGLHTFLGTLVDDGDLSEEDEKKLYAQAETLLANNRNVGGAPTQDLVFEALESKINAMIDEDVLDDEDADKIRTLLDLAEARGGIGGKPIAAPGTKAHKRLETLREDLEARLESNERDIIFKRENAQAEARQRVEAIEGLYLSGEADWSETETKIRETMGSHFTEDEITFQLVDLKDAEKKTPVTGDAKAYNELDLLGIDYKLTLEDLKQARRDGKINKDQFDALYGSYIKDTPQDERKYRAEQIENAKVNAVVSAGVHDLRVYSEGDLAAIKPLKEKLERDVAEAFDPSDPTGSQVKIKKLVDDFKTDNASILQNRLEGQYSRQADNLARGIEGNRKGLEAALPLDGVDDSGKVEQFNAIYAEESRKVLQGIIDKVNGERDARGDFLVGDARDAKIKKLMDEGGYLDITRAVQERLRPIQAATERTESLSFRQVPGRTDADLDAIGEDTTLEGGQTPGQIDALDYQEGLQDVVGVLRRQDLTPEEFAEELAEAREQFTADPVVIDSWIDSVTNVVVRGQDARQATAAAWNMSGKQGRDAYRIRRLLEDLNPEQSKKLLRELHMVRGLDASQIIAGDLPEGLTVSDIDPGLMSFNLTPDELDTMKADYMNAENQTAGSGSETTFGKLITALGHDLTFTSADNKVVHTAVLIWQMQSRLQGRLVNNPGNN